MNWNSIQKGTFVLLFKLFCQKILSTYRFMEWGEGGVGRGIMIPGSTPPWILGFL